MTPTDDELRDRFRDLQPVPFPQSLEERIISAAQALPRERGGPTVRRRRNTQSWLSAVAGTAAGFVLAAGAWYYGGVPMNHVGSHTNAPAAHNQQLTVNNASTAKRVATPSPDVFGLVDAPISVRLWLGPQRGSTQNNTVYATLTNVGTNVIQSGTIFGVLSLHEAHTLNPDLGHSSWVSFVDAPNEAINPGDSVSWSFRPVGAVTTAAGDLTDVPSLRFFQVGFVLPAKADAAWRAVPVAIDQVSVAQRQQWKTGQSIGVTARITNTTDAPIDLSHTLAVIWFAPNQGADWTQPTVVRFLDRVTPDVVSHTTLKPGQSERCLFRLIGARNTDFLGMAPNVSFVVTNG